MLAENLRGHGTVLIVDDEEFVRKTARMTLERYGYQVLVASNGQEGVEVFRAHADEVEAVLLDMTMPVMGGVETMRVLREIRPDVKVVATSGFSEQEAVAQFGQEISGYLQKPYRSAQLGAAIKRVVLGPEQTG